MKWPTWDQAAVVAAACAVIALVLRRTRPTRLRLVALSAATEIAILASLYSVWRLARVLPLAQTEGAIDRGRQIDNLQHALHMPTELSLQQFVLRYDWLARFTNYYYAVVHVPALIAFLVWLFVRHRDQYSPVAQRVWRSSPPSASSSDSFASHRHGSCLISATSISHRTTDGRCTARSEPACPTSSRRCHPFTSGGQRSCRSGSSPSARAGGDGSSCCTSH